MSKIGYPAQPQPDYVGGAGTELPYPPVTPATPDLADGVLGKYLYFDPSFGVTEGSGPNQGWMYIGDPPAFRPVAIVVNRALQPTDSFYRLQSGGRSGTVLYNGRRPCGPAFMRHAAEQVPEHEIGHYTRARDFWTSAATAAEFEGYRLYDESRSADVPEFKTCFVNTLISRHDAIQTQWDHDSVLRVTCDFILPAN